MRRLGIFVETKQCLRAFVARHACLLVKPTARTCDRSLPDRQPAAAAKPGDVPADFILVSHGHGDHVGDTVAIAQAPAHRHHKLRDQRMVREERRQGPRSTAQRRPRFPVWPGQTDAGLPRLGSARRQQQRQSVRLPHLLHNDGEIYDAADTGLFGDMKLIGEEGIDLAILPIGDNYTMGRTTPCVPSNSFSRKRCCRSTTTRST